MDDPKQAAVAAILELARRFEAGEIAQAEYEAGSLAHAKLIAEAKLGDIGPGSPIGGGAWLREAIQAGIPRDETPEEIIANHRTACEHLSAIAAMASKARPDSPAEMLIGLGRLAESNPRATQSIVVGLIAGLSHFFRED